MKSSWRRAGGLVAAGVALLWLLINLVLNTAWLEPLINRHPERFSMHWGRALMLWPGRVVVWEMDLQGQTRRNAWRIRVDRASGQVALLPLRHRELRITWLEAASPVIEVMRSESELPSRPQTGDGLQLVFEHIQIHSPVRFVSDDVQLETQAQIQTGWRQRLRGGEFELLPSRVQLSETRVSHGERHWLEAAQVEGELRIAAHRRRDYPGIGLLQWIQARLDVQARAPGLAVGPDQPFLIQAGKGTLDGHFVLDNGVFGADTRLVWQAPVSFNDGQGFSPLGTAQVGLNAMDEHLALRVVLPAVPDLIDDFHADLQLTSRTIPIAPWETQIDRLNGTVSLASHFSSLAWAQPFLSRLPNVVLEGNGVVKGNLVLEKGHLAAGTMLDVDRASFSLDAYSHRFHGAAHASAKIEDNDAREAEFISEVVLDQFDIASLQHPDRPLGAGKALRLSLSGPGELSRLRDTLQARLSFNNAHLPDLSRFNAYLPQHGLRLVGGTGQLSADMQMDVGRQRNSGQFSLNATAATLQMGDLMVRSDLALDARLNARGWHDPYFQLPGSRLSLRRLSVIQPVEEQQQGWWAVAEVSDGAMRLDVPMNLSADAAVTMRDIGPLLTVFAQRRHFPAWVRRIVNAGEAEVTGRVHLQDHCLRINPAEANNARFVVQARLQFCEKLPEGQLYLGWHKLGLGMALSKGERQFHWHGAKKWFDAQTLH